jgi:hypothetical protein
MNVGVKGLEEVQAKMTQMLSDLHGQPMLRGMRDATLLVQRDARLNAPVDTGRLRASILPEIRTMHNEIQGVVGTPVTYAPPIEEGARAHWPPPGALEPWARRHGIPEFLVRRSIGTFGISKMAYRKLGTKGFRMFERAVEENLDKIANLIGRAVGYVVNR